MRRSTNLENIFFVQILLNVCVCVQYALNNA